jgi:hypothetical protein
MDATTQTKAPAKPYRYPLGKGRTVRTFRRTPQNGN